MMRHATLLLIAVLALDGCRAGRVLSRLRLRANDDARTAARRRRVRVLRAVVVVTVVATVAIISNRSFARDDLTTSTQSRAPTVSNTRVSARVERRDRTHVLVLARARPRLACERCTHVW